ncbi:acetolactate decarboxylase [Flavobacterium sp.]|uniref:acetolactate decarboxylase n=1 Tax=Flavobacterium sp. TaxID=239 RepID=UPI00262A0890|nr:acetolactate decarboxylase [Flavobacterium sp.]MDD3005560.1 acetolactate decarboxylase [Flavobacterium sp.]
MKHYYYTFLCFFIGLTFSFAQQNDVKVSGAMKNVMREGQLFGTISLDTIQNKDNLYGLGPVEYLKGELLIIDGKSYVSSVNPDGSIKMEETFQVKAPFFVYSNVSEWKEVTLPKKVKTMNDLDDFLNELQKKYDKPFAFKLTGKFKKIDFHIQNLPEGTVVKSMNDVHTGQGKYIEKNVNGDIIGFFSTKHQRVFTHHDSYIHIHFISSDKTKMGHIDELVLGNKNKLFLPKEVVDFIETNN